MQYMKKRHPWEMGHWRFCLFQAAQRAFMASTATRGATVPIMAVAIAPTGHACVTPDSMEGSVTYVSLTISCRFVCFYASYSCILSYFTLWPMCFLIVWFCNLFGHFSWAFVPFMTLVHCLYLHLSLFSLPYLCVYMCVCFVSSMP